MAYLPRLTMYGGRRETLDAFAGYFRGEKIREGEWNDEKNLTAMEYPVLATRRRRGVVETLESPQGMIAKEALAYVDGHDVYFGEYRIDMGLTLTGPKQLVSMGAYLLIWPDKKYLNTQDFSDKGSMENSVTTAADTSISLCLDDGTDVDPITGPTAPEAPENGAYWLDTGGNTPILKVWAEATGMWTSVATTYLKLRCANIGDGFQKFDGVTISGFTEDRAGLNGSYTLYGQAADYIVIPGLLDSTDMTETEAVTVERTVPDMDYVTECGNRVWGCRYGMSGGRSVNEIYACKLGDFKNWNCFMGISTDSYAASRGSDGPWTGAATLQGHPIFFKENFIEKVYPSANGAHQIVSTPARGVQRGCWRSLQVVGETLYYKGVKDVCAYTGSLPAAVSLALGEETYTDARAGTAGELYYISMQDTQNRYTLFCYDTQKRIWHKEDSVKPMCFAEVDGELYYIDEDSYDLVCVSGKQGEPEEGIDWMAESGVIGFEDAGQKYLSRFVFRAELQEGASIHLEIQYDEGKWIDKGTFRRTGLGSFVLPVAPRPRP